MDTEHEREELAREEFWRRRAHQRFMRAPDCRDPDHPGCRLCEEPEEEPEE